LRAHDLAHSRMIARMINRPHAPSFCTQNESLNLIIIFEAGAVAAESGAKDLAGCPNLAAGLDHSRPCESAISYPVSDF